ncbi:pyridine nucleotide-disulfide oxidoreductase family protein [Modicisalibacter ilicicola DSM 19980]|uniref:Pyridine nucleotide-disulfide oxidoreductase family protein n=1 Tax=Modicisalibacter ilicicola DSM 19980 TaxID=1121942 RepID=A0A1M5BLV0_9GAMM|nr:FAD-dependent oxidoreductase [Halomonas ilicicola]SHF43481.1 pyridine nucleotide-disulfide oxidoreductase family protein [Halomonas ilicicola DSM 19980]
MTDTSHIVLVGAGHAHLHVAAHAGQLIDAGARVTLLSPGAFWYSGMASGMLGGEYSDADDSLDPAALITRAGGRFIKDRVVAVDREARELHLARGAPLPFDLLSLNLGSRVDMPPISGLEEARGVWPAKPIDGLYRLRDLLESALADPAPLPRLAVIGGGPTGVELAANLLALSERYGRPFEISLVSASKRLLEHSPRSASTWLARRLSRRGLRIEMAASAIAYRQGHLILDDGMQLPADHIVMATGLVAPLLTGELGLDHHPHHGLAITPALHTPYDDRIFAVGDCAWLKHSPYPKLGVFGVRQGPILLHNLAARLQDESLEDFHPQPRYLSILNLGDGRGMALWGRLWWPGRLAMRVKRRLDHGFMDHYRCR